MSEAPPSVLKAAQVMKAGMVASLIGIPVYLLSEEPSRAAIQRIKPDATAAQIADVQRALPGELIAFGLLMAALWLWMAQSCRAGKSWARTLSTVLFAVYTVWTLLSVFGESAGAEVIYDVVVWLIALTAVRFLWQGPSSEYFRKNG